MITPLKTLLELLREVRSGSTWLAIVLALAFADLYAIAHFEHSLVVVVQADPARLMPALGSRWLAELIWAVSAAAITWFYVLAMVLVPLWHWLLYIARLHLPGWLTSRAWPRSDGGWHWVDAVRRCAIAEGNALLLGICEERRLRARTRDRRLTCVLGSLIFMLAAACLATDATGPSLLGAATDAFGHLPKFAAFVSYFMLFPGAAYVLAVLFEHGVEYDDRVYLPEWAPRAPEQK